MNKKLNCWIWYIGCVGLIVIGCERRLQSTHSTLWQRTQYQNKPVNVEQFILKTLGHDGSTASCKVEYPWLEPGIDLIQLNTNTSLADTLYRYQIGSRSFLMLLHTHKGKEQWLGLVVLDSIIPLLNGVKIGQLRDEIQSKIEGLIWEDSLAYGENKNIARRIELIFHQDTLRRVEVRSTVPLLQP